jgi:hypothetical protein
MAQGRPLPAGEARVLTEVHRPRAGQAVDVAGAPLMTQTGHARSQHFPEVALCYAVARYPLPLGTAFPNFPPSVSPPPMSRRTQVQ